MKSRNDSESHYNGPMNWGRLSACNRSAENADPKNRHRLRNATAPISAFSNISPHAKLSGFQLIFREELAASGHNAIRRFFDILLVELTALPSFKSRANIAPRASTR